MKRENIKTYEKILSSPSSLHIKLQNQQKQNITFTDPLRQKPFELNDKILNR